MIAKRIAFKPTENEEIFVLTFGDLTETGRIDDRSVSNNGDWDKILATIISAVNRYTKRYPNRAIYFMASSDARTRLYRMAISLRLKELSRKYRIYADLDGEDDWLLFQKNMDVKAFLIVRKVF